jgi:hypothetical protein
MFIKLGDLAVGLGGGTRFGSGRAKVVGFTKTFSILRGFFSFAGGTKGGWGGSEGFRLPSRASKASHLFLLLTRVETVEMEALESLFGSVMMPRFFGFFERRCLGFVRTLERGRVIGDVGWSYSRAVWEEESVASFVVGVTREGEEREEMGEGGLGRGRCCGR